MFTSTRQRNTGHGMTHIDVTSLIDVLFVLLLFFLVTATFVKESGVTVRRPAAASSDGVATGVMRISIASSGSIYYAGKPVDLAEVGSLVRQYMTENPAAGVIVIADETVPTGRVVSVMDAARIAGAKDVAIATRGKDRP